MSRVRNSNIELLRIIAALMVFMLHYNDPVLWGGIIVQY